ncbi:MAG: hypothetical protein U0T07_05690 [Chitinophagales bacterium]
MSTLILKTTSKKKLDLIEALVKELGISIQKETSKNKGAKFYYFKCY